MAILGVLFIPATAARPKELEKLRNARRLKAERHEQTAVVNGRKARWLGLVLDKNHKFCP